MFVSEADQRDALLLAELAYENPFTPARARLEQEVLGDDFVTQALGEADPWALGPGRGNPNVEILVDRAQALLVRNRAQLSEAQGDAQQLYAALVRFVLFYRFEPELKPLALATLGAGPTESGTLAGCDVSAFDSFVGEMNRWVPSRKQQNHLLGDSAHLFALAFQLCRAFQSLYRTILGASSVSQALRARVWNTIFTFDRRRYERALFDRMHETSTLIVGPSGTGKELVAYAIAASRYLRFDAKKRRFIDEVVGSFLPLNVSALPVHLVEAELFGHKRGAFSGAISDREGYLESCPKGGTLFLDEIGELSLDLQVKLLRTLQTRSFHRVGETKARPFLGKFVSATNRNLDRAVEDGSLREDFFFRIQADVIQTPPLKDKLADRPQDLDLLVQNIAQRLLPPREVDAFTHDAASILRRGGALSYEWPGNVRQLEQCVRSILVSGQFELFANPASNPAPPLRRALLDSGLDADQLLDLYAHAVLEQTNNYSEAARRLGLDRRTVKARAENAAGLDAAPRPLVASQRVPT